MVRSCHPESTAPPGSAHPASRGPLPGIFPLPLGRRRPCVRELIGAGPPARSTVVANHDTLAIRGFGGKKPVEKRPGAAAGPSSARLGGGQLVAVVFRLERA